MDTDNLDVAATHKAIIASLVRTTRAAALLVPDNVILHKAQDPQFASDLGIASSELLQVANAVLKFLAGPESRARPFAHAADVAENWSSAVEVMEQALDKADMALDQFYNRNAGSESESAATAAGTVRVAGSSGSTVRVMTSASIPCPQQAFPRGEVDNDARTPWVPKIKSKPHARVPLVAPVVGPETPVDTAFPHPYAYELEHLEWPDHLFEVPAPQEHQGSDETGAVGVRPGPLESTPYEFVDTLPALQRMLAEMRGAHEVAVDLEHHNYRTYLGLTCLMQVSTRTHDWIVDTLALRMHCHLLNEVFADPEVVKVLHGAESDVIWLQRDLGLYLVNLFDTFHATRALAFPRNSLAYLLKRYCDVNANKQYQLADWRMRPLPADMERYAREDTHYLLYIYDQLRAELAANSPQQQPPLGSSSSTKTRAQLIEVVLRKSVTTASQVFTKERYDAETGSGALGWFNMMLKNPRPMTRRASAALKALHAWRDALAREEDESVHYVTPNHALFALAEKMPQDPQAVVAHVHPSPPMLKLHAGEVARIL
ncbi:ribonuclease H-like domain-containing protein, partial [Blastocladiella britannica]